MTDKADRIALLTARLAGAAPAIRARAAQEEASGQRGTVRPQGAAYSTRWANGDMPGKRHMALRTGRTGRICPACWEQEILTSTSDKYPYCLEHAALGGLLQEARMATLVLMGVSRASMAQWAEDDRARREAAKEARKGAPRRAVTIEQARANLRARLQNGTIVLGGEK